MSLEVRSKVDGLSETSSSSGIQDGLGRQEGRSYRRQEKYFSSAAVLPDLLFNILNGCTESQSFELYSSGRRQGCVSFKVVDSASFTFEKSVSGSFVVSSMTPLFWKFVGIANLKEAFDVKDACARNCIQTIFESVLKGVASGTVQLGSNAEVDFQCTSYHFSCVLHSEEERKAMESFKKVDAFFKDFNGREFLGQLK